jgi:hypothetical protein
MVTSTTSTASKKSIDDPVATGYQFIFCGNNWRQPFQTEGCGV